MQGGCWVDYFELREVPAVALHHEQRGRHYQQQGEAVRDVVLIHAQEVALVQHLHLYKKRNISMCMQNP